MQMLVWDRARRSRSSLGSAGSGYQPPKTVRWIDVVVRRKRVHASHAQQSASSGRQQGICARGDRLTRNDLRKEQRRTARDKTACSGNLTKDKVAERKNTFLTNAGDL